MKQSVVDIWHTFSEPLEGRVPFMYLDSAEPRGLVTVAVGLLCPVSYAVTLPFVHPDGRPATRDEIAAEWARVDARQDLKRHGGMVFRNITTLRLTDAAVDALVMQKLMANDAELTRRWPAFQDFPADAQLALHSWAWGVGGAARYPKLDGALAEQDFDAAADEITMNPQRGTIVERNRRNRLLLRNAARVRDMHLDPEALYYPAELGREIPPPAETLPEGVDPAESMQARREMLSDALGRNEDS